MRICETFYSLQGEGLQIGEPTFFIRVAGCGLDCSWCDTGYAKEEGEEVTLEALVERAMESEARVVCITGGEPLEQKDTIKLIDRLLSKGLYVTLETNGAQTLEELPCDEKLIVSMDVKCPSSGMDDRMRLQNIELLGYGDQLKFIVSDERDYEHAKGVIDTYAPKCTIVFTPVGGSDLRWLAERVLDDGLQARVLPQLHKLIWGDDRKR